MDKTSYRLLTLTVSCMLFLSITAEQVIAWPCSPPPPGDCYTCTPTGWEPYGDCWGGCGSCYSCVNCYCECTSECCEHADCPRECWSCVDCICEDDNSKCATCQVCVAGWCADRLGLEELATGCSPDLPNGRICLNAQACYEKAKWKAIVKGGGTANVTSTGTAGVTFAGIEGSDPSALANGDEFWVIAGTEVGTYEITLTHNELTTCTATDDEKVFKFEFEYTKVNWSSGISGGATVGEVTGSIDAEKIEAPPAEGVQNAGYVRWHYELKVVTNPADLYGGNVKARASVDFTTNGQMKIRNYAPPVLWSGFAIGVNFGPVTVAVAAAPGTVPYGSSIGGADTEIQIDGQPAIQLGDVKHDYMEVGFPLILPTKSKTWDTDLNQTENDINRTYVVGTPIDFWCKLGAGSNVSLFKYWLGINISTYVGINDQAISSVEVTEHDGIFEITS